MIERSIYPFGIASHDIHSCPQGEVRVFGTFRPSGHFNTSFTPSEQYPSPTVQLSHPRVGISIILL